ncbi:glycosyltransferase family 39 protein [Alcaligenaceae bacterium]|nr:glycosyltransferase family 39 protein [Alcaligenaceae bacterium]
MHSKDMKVGIATETKRNCQISEGQCKKLLTVFILVFVYALCMMSFIREIAVPYVYPFAIDGHLPGDAQYYNALALKQLEAMNRLGMTAFQLRPEGQGAAGIASIIYWVHDSVFGVVLTNSLLHATSTLILVLILRQYFSNRISLISVIPLALSPYMMLWFSQVNKETYSLLGILLFVYGISTFIKPRLNIGKILYSLCFLLVGIGLICIVRPYLNRLLLPPTTLILLFALLYRLKTRRPIKELVGFILASVLVLLSLNAFNSGAASDETIARIAAGGEPAGNVETLHTVAQTCLQNTGLKNWLDEPLLPRYVNTQLRGIMTQRCLVFTLLNSQTNPVTQYAIIHRDILPAGSLEALRYLPYAIMIGIFSPWPAQWLYGVIEQHSIFYLIASLEAFALYVGLIGIILYLIDYRRFELSGLLVLAFSSMTIIGMATPYIGAVYRYRYPWWILIICIGAAATFTLFQERQIREP